MPNRIIKESALASRDLNKLSDGAERLFFRLTLVADDFGRFDADPQVVKARCFPLRVDTLKTPLVSKWLQELSAASLIQLYKVGDRVLGHFPAWSKHQQVRAKASKFPDPQASDSICNQLQSNVLVSEIESEKRDRDTISHLQANGFEDFWQAYPRKKAKGDAEKAWKTLKPDSTLLAVILGAVASQVRSPEWTKDAGQFIPYPASWLRAKRWQDGVEHQAEVARRVPLVVSPSNGAGDKPLPRDEAMKRLRELTTSIGRT